MRRFFATLWLILKGASVQFATIIPAMIAFHFGRSLRLSLDLGMATGLRDRAWYRGGIVAVDFLARGRALATHIEHATR